MVTHLFLDIHVFISLYSYLCTNSPWCDSLGIWRGHQVFLLRAVRGSGGPIYYVHLLAPLASFSSRDLKNLNRFFFLCKKDTLWRSCKKGALAFCLEVAIFFLQPIHRIHPSMPRNCHSDHCPLIQLTPRSAIDVNMLRSLGVIMCSFYSIETVKVEQWVE